MQHMQVFLFNIFKDYFVGLNYFYPTSNWIWKPMIQYLIQDKTKKSDARGFSCRLTVRPNVGVATTVVSSTEKDRIKNMHRD